MAVQPEDRATADIFDHPSKTAQEELHLAAEHHLVKVQAFIRDPKKAEKKTKGAERVAKHREKLKEAGLVQTSIPATIAQQIKETGDFDKWLSAQKIETVVEKPIEKIVEKTVEKLIPIELSAEQIELIELGKQVKKQTGIRAKLISFLMR